MKPILTVSEATQIIKNLFESNEILRQVYIRGEISNFKHHISGHMYFTLKDKKAQIRCVMFKSNNMLLPFIPENGMKVIVFGYVSVFAKNGEYQLYAEDIEPDGIGALHVAFEKLKARLEAEGLFDIENKRPIPFLPKKIGLVTSITGAAIRDLLTVICRRFPNIHIIIVPVLVQGNEAASEISQALWDLNEIGDLDVIILGRGGGSIEELWAFNEEKVARAIFESKIPVISAVGHETDYTIADFVSDQRAPTPSAAGELVVPEKNVLKNELRHLYLRLLNNALGAISVRKQRLEYIKQTSTYKKPENITANYRLILDQILRTIQKEINTDIFRRKMAFKSQVDRLDALSPLAILKRGYSLCTHLDDEKIISQVGDVDKGDLIRIILSDGGLICQVQNCQEKGDI